MKKISLKMIPREEFLSREELKSITGGETGSDAEGGLFCKSTSCTLSIQGDDGNWVTKTGTCSSSASSISRCYCDAGLGEVHLTSNSGISRCYRDW
ncbi:hypothetical protein [Sphingobacterium multivorum]|uniref:hypothetical protein n=1 Tax=Sphingobacterium multivorum TaxID=28454 RepID=UPI0028B097AC|nr:hypothetical protein [Sphingobacterium multivorum]